MVFVLAIYLVSFKTRPAEVISHQINVVEVKPGTSLARVTSVTGLFAPNHPKYNLQLPGRHLIAPLPNTGGMITNTTGTDQKPKADISVEQTPGQTNLEFREMNSWVMRGVAAIEDASFKGSINAEINFKDINGWQRLHRQR